MSAIATVEYSHRGKALLISHRSIVGDASVGARIDRQDINYFAHMRGEIAQYILWTPKGKQRRQSYNLDKFTFFQLEVKGKIVWDSRDHYPIDVVEWQARFDKHRRAACNP